MTEQEQLAREWAEKIKKKASRSPSWFDEECIAAADLVLANTTPPTMEGVEWDAREHRGLGTVGEDGTEWVMLHMMPNDWIACISSDLRKYRHLKPKWLTPNGKRYELVDITDKPEPGPEPEPEPEHPKTLSTVEDYENAPVGTVVAIRRGKPWTKNKTRLWGREYNRALQVENEQMSAISREVLRWGWSK